MFQETYDASIQALETASCFKVTPRQVALTVNEPSVVLSPLKRRSILPGSPLIPQFCAGYTQLPGHNFLILQLPVSVSILILPQLSVHLHIVSAVSRIAPFFTRESSTTDSISKSSVRTSADA